MSSSPMNWHHLPGKPTSSASQISSLEVSRGDSGRPVVASAQRAGVSVRSRGRHRSAWVVEKASSKDQSHPEVSHRLDAVVYQRRIETESSRSPFPGPGLGESKNTSSVPS